MLYVIRMNPGNRIRLIRLKARMSQGELGRMVGLSQGQVSNIENGDRNVNLEWLRRIARALAVSVADLLADEDHPDRLSEEERNLIAAWRESDDATRQFLLTTATAVAARDRANAGPA